MDINHSHLGLSLRSCLMAFVLELELDRFCFSPELKLNASDPSNLILSWEGDAVLLFTDDLSAGFEVIQGATSPHTIKTVDQGFYILRTAP